MAREKELQAKAAGNSPPDSEGARAGATGVVTGKRESVRVRFGNCPTTQPVP